MGNDWNNSRLWAFHADMNRDGVITIADVWLWIKWLYFYPGDLVLSLIGPTALGRFLEYSPSDYGGQTSSNIAFSFWLFFVVFIYSIFKGHQHMKTAKGKAEHAERVARYEAERIAGIAWENTANETRPWYSKKRSVRVGFATYAALLASIYGTIQLIDWLGKN